ncbi:peptidase M22 [Croceibacterium mercuriale]|uniref:Peptidase M22 n=1 Tax=Croceibacterium mercuriale TaxID=1572751 RepID=A0A0B2BV94_9SPHN|nr:tRNA (adenosine(37)-N6)-threonylcarbamoyltransferase complex dimerization subunit type 1 TsaB [Croceibacterium mercuriale]KHL25553.1 peptidase M22 [Croceibacterium mercuriale]
MRLLAIDTATPACSVALFHDDRLIAGDYAVIGRGHAERLVPMIAALPDRGRADRICVSLGPGSFTGVRIGLATARALGLAWGAEVLGYPTLALVAAMAREESAQAVSVAMTGGHGEWFVQSFTQTGLPDGDAMSLPPQEAQVACTAPLVAGDRAAELVAVRGWGEAQETLPDARAFDRLPPACLLSALSPLYGRAPDARLPA